MSCHLPGSFRGILRPRFRCCVATAPSRVLVGNSSKPEVCTGKSALCWANHGRKTWIPRCHKMPRPCSLSPWIQRVDLSPSTKIWPGIIQGRIGSACFYPCSTFFPHTCCFSPPAPLYMVSRLQVMVITFSIWPWARRIIPTDCFLDQVLNFIE